MTDISVIILAGKEELHIGRCLERLAPREPRQIIADYEIGRLTK